MGLEMPDNTQMDAAVLRTVLSTGVACFPVPALLGGAEPSLCGAAAVPAAIFVNFGGSAEVGGSLRPKPFASICTVQSIRLETLEILPVNRPLSS